MFTVKPKLAKYNQQSLLRQRMAVCRREKNTLDIKSRQYVNFCSNDYLGLATSSPIKKALINAVENYGFGSSSSAQICGYFEINKEVEQKFAEFLNRDSAILFNSGYLANLGVLSVLANRDTTVISDKFCHASIIDGIILSRTKHCRFSHQNTKHLESILRDKKRSLVVTESIFSMEGDISPLDKIATICKKNNSLFIVDDAHAVGILGQHGQGGCNLFNLSQNDVPCLISPLGKAFGCFGAIVSGSAEIIEILLQLARTYRYTTAIPPAMCAAILKSLEIVQQEDWRREKLIYLTKYFNDCARQRNLPLISNDITPIRSISVGDNVAVQNIQRRLMEKGFLISCIRPPTVPKNTARIRISLNCFHTTSQIDQLLNWMAKYVN